MTSNIELHPTTEFNLKKIRADFPILSREIRGRSLVYLDNAASTLKPVSVINRVSEYYRNETANVHRGAHFLAEQGTIAYEGARELCANWINARSTHEIIFTRGTTESINLVAYAYGEKFFEPGDEIILSALEHHSNIVPWQQVAKRKGCLIRVVPVDENGVIDFEIFQKMLSSRTRFVSLSWCSNALGTIAPIKKFIDAAHWVGAKILIDAAQAIAHIPTDVQQLDCDFLAFSGHKIYAPYGIGVLYGKADLLEAMDPYQTGGSMISEVTFETSTWAAVPHKFEAGTPNISAAIGLGEALKYLRSIGLKNAAAQEKTLLEYATRELADVPGLKIVGQSANKAAIISFVMDGAHASDIGSILDQQGIAIRAGHHCCQPLMRQLGLSGTARASFSFYNTVQEIDVLKQGLIKAKEFLG
jgi:cysteine desulfurase/selenocysteine lyase